MNGTDSSSTDANDKIELEDFFNENPCGLEEKHNDYSMCNDEEILERLNLVPIF